VNYLFKQLR